MGRGPESLFLQRGHIDGLQIYEKMLNITSNKVNSNQNPKGIPPQPVRLVIVNKTRNNKFLRERGEKGTLPHYWC